MIYNLSKKKYISRAPVCAISILARARGMIGRDFINFDAMIFENCNSIHTMFMSIDLDVLFIDSENRICAVRKSMKPWRICARCASAITVIELPAGTIENTGTDTGDFIDLKSELSDERGSSVLNKELIKTAETPIPISENRR